VQENAVVSRPPLEPINGKGYARGVDEGKRLWVHA